MTIILMIITTFLSICFVLGSIALVHEFGHYITAKLTGIWVIEFAIGFGNRLLKFRWGETLYSLRPFPLGGFVRLAGMDAPEEEEKPSDEAQKQSENPEAKPTTEPQPEPDPDDVIPLLDPTDPRGYPSKSRWVKVLVLAAGSIMNLFWAVVLYFIIFTVSGGPLSNMAVLDLSKGKPAELAGIKKGDIITAVAGVKLEEWSEGISVVQKHGGKEIILDVIRDHPIPRPGFGGGLIQGSTSHNNGNYLIYSRENLKIPVTPAGSEGTGKIGVSLAPNIYDFKSLSSGKALSKAFERTGAIIMQTVMGIAGMIFGETEADFAGPVKIMHMIKQQAHKGLADLLSLTALLSINIGLINLFPFPVLDGGRIVFVLLEVILGFINSIIGTKLIITPEWEEKIHFLGMIFLLTMLVFVTYKDIISFLS
ncbi:MAG: site-2 protease family protein [Candidatus Riflebacteria bacterium]|nr:site-2 protease family protein [Candidatus Riflebacteria bacterium]